VRPDGGGKRGIERTLRATPPLRVGDPFLREDVGEMQRAPPPSAAAVEGGEEVGDEVDMADRGTGDPRGDGDWRRRRRRGLGFEWNRRGSIGGEVAVVANSDRVEIETRVGIATGSGKRG
jgi:hypothetical protein